MIMVPTNPTHVIITTAPLKFCRLFSKLDEGESVNVDGGIVTRTLKQLETIDSPVALTAVIT